MILRPATPDDADALSRLGKESFCAAFEHLYRPADLRVFLQDVYARSVIADEIADPAITHRLAEDAVGDGLTGFVKVRQPSWYAHHSDAARPMGLGQLYTDPARTGEGIGAALMDWAITFARQHDHDAIQLSVWSENDGAQRFYARYGFSKIADITFRVGDQLDEEFLLELEL
ncbi:GNAT family N-acetyltransferase [Aurantiacibacter spongiae]|uniref:N-acetyltransferase n=1 Tax=Aurantiacibacter spongiae TaxID=2488860 RepID=A0A3N5DAX3_9SPHN|nr:N-acetyltransferase [Aurantiacibacter spongiae]RPF71868.1 N-acetyltransferase [Aurantiacibacter spongiae]